MKKLLISVILAVIVFAAVYVAQCYMVPGWRIKLAAPAMVYFAASLRHMVLLKGLIAAAAAAVAVAVQRKSHLTDVKK